MSGELELLKMLEPLVRPAGTPARQVSGRTPVEDQSFEELLGEAAQGTGVVDAIGAGEIEEAGISEVKELGESEGMMRWLGGLGRIENSAVMRVLSEGAVRGSVMNERPGTTEGMITGE